MTGSCPAVWAVLDILLDLNKLRGSAEHAEASSPAAAFTPDDPDYGVVAAVELSMTGEKAGPDTFRETGRMQTGLELDCSRCVEPFEMPVDAAFELRYVPQPVAAEGEVVKEV